MRIAMLVGGLWLAGVAASDAAVLRMYMSPVGNDALNGRSSVNAVRTLARVQALVRLANPTEEVEIHIAPGVYYGQTVRWTFFNGHPITFTSHNYGTVRPVFDGLGAALWFRVAAASGAETRLRFRYIKVQNYNSAMLFAGNRLSRSGWNGGNELYGMYFYRIGGKYSANGISDAAVQLVNSRRNRIVNSHFINIENRAANASSMQAVQIQSYSSQNGVERNRFELINGDPVIVRDLSNFNRILSNVFRRAGLRSYLQDTFCQGSTCAKVECPSYGNEFSFNVLYSGYSAEIRAALSYGSNEACGPLPTRRLIQTGNEFR